MNQLNGCDLGNLFNMKRWRYLYSRKKDTTSQ